MLFRSPGPPGQPRRRRGPSERGHGHVVANQYLALCRLAKDGKQLEKKVYELPKELDQEIAGLKLQTMGIAIDKLTAEQISYASDYSAGT